MTSRQSRSLLLLAGSPLLALAANSASSQMYKHFPTPSTWEVAKITCSGYGGMLATVDGAEENQRTMAECASERCWIGLNDVVTEGSFVWDSSNMQPAFRKWAPGEPSNTQYTDDAFYGTTDEDCVYIHGATYSDVAKRSDWGDHPCVQKLPFVCQIPVHFEVSEYAQDWETAQAQCETEGGRLASIESLADNSNALGVCEDDRCWIGLNDRMTEGTMRWADGKALVDGTNNVYRNWAPGEPSNTVYTKDEFYGTTDEDCVYIHGAKYSDAAKRGKWGDHPCTQKMHAICEVPSASQFVAFAEAKTWQEADEHCTSIADGATLASVASMGQNGIVENQCPDDRCWIGLNDRQLEGRFVWATGTLLEKGDFKQWAPGEPSNTQYTDDKYYGTTDEDCVYIHGNGYSDEKKRGSWGDHPCDQKMAFVCSVPVGKDKQLSVSTKPATAMSFDAPAATAVASEVASASAYDYGTPTAGAVAAAPSSDGWASGLDVQQAEASGAGTPLPEGAGKGSSMGLLSGLVVVCAVLGVAVKAGVVNGGTARKAMDIGNGISSKAAKGASSAWEKVSGKKAKATSQYALMLDDDEALGDLGA